MQNADRRQMKLGFNIVANGASAAGWRMPSAQADAAMDIEMWKDMARAAERACVSSVRCARSGSSSSLSLPNRPSTKPSSSSCRINEICASPSRVGVRSSRDAPRRRPVGNYPFITDL